MKDIDHYQIAIIGLVVDVSPKILERTKIALTKGVKAIESDDRCFIYDPEHPSVPKRKGESAGRICNYNPKGKWNWQIAMKDAIELMCVEDYDSHKLIMMVTDKVQEQDIYQISMGFNWDLKHDAGCYFAMCGIGKSYNKDLMGQVCEHHNRCDFISHNQPEELEDTIKNLYVKHLKNEGVFSEPLVEIELYKEENDRTNS